MIAHIQPSKLNGTIQAAASKSSMQRALAAALLKRGDSILHNPGHSNDDKAAIAVITALGARVEEGPGDTLVISSDGVKPITHQGSILRRRLCFLYPATGCEVGRSSSFIRVQVLFDGLEPV